MARLEEGQAGGGVAEAAGDGQEVAGAGSGAGDGGTAVQGAERGHSQDQPVGSGDVSAGDTGAYGGAFVAEAGGEVVEPFDRQVAGEAEADEQRGGFGPHGGDVGEVLRGGLSADVVRTGPIAAEVPTLKKEVRRHDDPPTGSSEHCGVVTRTKQDSRRLWQASDNTCNDPEFAKICDCDSTPPGVFHVRWRFGTLI